MAITTINYLSLTGLNKYDAKIKEFIAAKVNEGTSNSFKFVNLEDGVLKFYTVNPITEDTVADFEIELPEQDLSNLMELVKDATAGNIATFGANGQVVDSGVAVADLATKAEVNAVQDSVNALNAYIGEIPEDADSTNVIAYINEKAQEVLESATGGSSESAASVKLALDTYKAENNAKVDANTEAIEAIAADYLKDADKQVLQDQIDANESAIQLLTNGVDSETIDGVNDLIAYVNEHGTEVTKMQGDIAANTAAIEAEKAARESADSAITGRLDVLEAIDHNAYASADATMKAELEGKIDAKADASVVEGIDAAYKAADEAMGNRIAEVEGKAHVHENADVLAGITADNVEAWSKAEANANAYTDAKLDGIDLSGIATNAAAIEKLEESLGEGGTTTTAIADAVSKADAAQANIDEFEATYAEDKAALEAKDAEIEGNISAIQAEVDALKEVEHVEITEDQIDELFA